MRNARATDLWDVALSNGSLVTYRKRSLTTCRPPFVSGERDSAPTFTYMLTELERLHHQRPGGHDYTHASGG